MKISFCIPTYNRAKYLAISLDKIVSQIEELHVENDVEVNLSDNASTDNTKEIWDNVVSKHPNVKFTYKCNEKNLGPDRNFLSAMHMAKGEYSLLWGDDDYLKDGGVKRIFELIEYGEQNDVQLMVSSTSIIDAEGKPLREKKFLREDINEMLVDFSDINQARSYFFLLEDMGGLLSFISDVIYKTSILSELPYHKQFTGTHYAFLNYWWGWLAKGKKLYYSNISFIDETVQYQPAYGFGVARDMVDYNGYLLIGEKLLSTSPFKKDFLSAFLGLHPILISRWMLLAEDKRFRQQLLPAMLKCGLSPKDVTLLEKSCKLPDLIKCLMYKLLPDGTIEYLKKIKKR